MWYGASTEAHPWTEKIVWLPGKIDQALRSNLFAGHGFYALCFGLANSGSTNKNIFSFFSYATPGFCSIR
jgi:hypothetical protein